MFCTDHAKPVSKLRLPGVCNLPIVKVARSKCSVPSEWVLAIVLGQCCFKNFFIGIFRMCSGNLDTISCSCAVRLAMWPSLMAMIAADLDSTAANKWMQVSLGYLSAMRRQKRIARSFMLIFAINYERMLITGDFTDCKLRINYESVKSLFPLMISQSIHSKLQKSEELNCIRLPEIGTTINAYTHFSLIK